MSVRLFRTTPVRAHQLPDRLAEREGFEPSVTPDIFCLEQSPEMASLFGAIIRILPSLWG